MNGKSSSATYVEKVANGEANPFHTIEALQENIGALRGALLKDGYDWPNPPGYPHWPAPMQYGEVVYHFEGIANYAQEILNAIAALLPDIYAASDGDTAAMERIKEPLKWLAEKHQKEWESF